MKRLVRVLVALVVVLIVLVIADRAAVKIAENKAESEVENTADSVTDLNLVIHGFPFLTQLAGGTLEHVSGTAATATLGGIRVTHVSVDVRDMAMSAPYDVKSGTATATIPNETMASLIQEKTGLSNLSVSADNESLRFSIPVLGQDLAISLAPEVADNQLTATVTGVSLDGATVSASSLPSSVSGLLEDIDVPLNLPEGLTLQSATVSPEGIVITIDGSDVALKGLFSS